MSPNGLQFGKHLPVAAVIEEETEDKGEEFGDRKTPPNSFDISGKAGDEPGDRQEDEKLTADADDHAVGTAANSLEDG